MKLQSKSKSPSPKATYPMLACALFLVFLAASAAGQAQRPKIVVHLDPASTEIKWVLKGNTHTTHGTFKLKGGMVSFDPATGAAEGELLVDLATGESGDPKRDANMQKQVLESDKYPSAFFHPTKITGMAGPLKPGSTETVAAQGTFNIHGADHPLTLTMQIKLTGRELTAKTHFVVPYVAWGMKDPSKLLLRVSKTVDVNIIAKGSVELPE